MSLQQFCGVENNTKDSDLKSASATDLLTDTREKRGANLARLLLRRIITGNTQDKMAARRATFLRRWCKVWGARQGKLGVKPIPGKIFSHDKRPAPPAKGDRPDFEWMMQESKHLASLIGVPPKTIHEIFKSSTDWEFILKIDALLEAAARKVVKVALAANEKMNPVDMEDFVDTLSMRGRTSLLKLLKASGCGEEESLLIDCVRILRNGFAHDITQMNLPLIEVIKKRGDKSMLIKGLSWTKHYEEDDLITMFEKDGSFLRFTILSGTLTFMILAYHAVIKGPK
jgi:hypothetical protein